MLATNRGRTLLNICFVAPHAFPLLARDEKINVIGGAELQMVIVAKELAMRGHKISMVCLDYGQNDKVEIDGIRVYRAFKPKSGIPIIRFLTPRLTKMWDALWAADAELYYQQTAGMLTGVVAYFCKKYKRKSVFASASNPDLYKATPRIQFLRDRLLYSYGVRNVDRIFVQNDEQSALCLTNYGRKSEIVRNCYQIPIYQKGEPVIPSILWVSTIRSVKRPHIFLDLADALPDCNFTMIGGPDDSEQTLYEEIKERASRLQNAIFHGFIPFWCIDKYFDQATIIVNTSESEGVPNALLQAWARGIPSVSFVDPGARFKGRTIGRIVSTVEEMASSIKELATNKEKRQQEGVDAKNYVRTHNSPEVIIPIYETFFKNICDEPFD